MSDLGYSGIGVLQFPDFALRNSLRRISTSSIIRDLFYPVSFLFLIRDTTRILFYPVLFLGSLFLRSDPTLVHHGIDTCLLYTSPSPRD